MVGAWIDEVAREVASGVSRRQALLRIGGGLLGLAATTLVHGEALAKKDKSNGNGNGNSACAHFCQGLSSKVRGKCTSDAAHGRGLCYQCGPAQPAGTNGILCGTTCYIPPANATAICTSGTPSFTCNTNYSACNGGCVLTSSFQTDAQNCGTCGNVCGTGTTCNAGVCTTTTPI
jgi:hypothetical protein